MKSSLKVSLSLALVALANIAAASSSAQACTKESRERLLDAKAVVVCGASKGFSDDERDLKRLYAEAKEDLESKTQRKDGFEITGSEKTGDWRHPEHIRRGRMVPSYDLSNVLYFKSLASQERDDDRDRDDRSVKAFACVSVFKKEIL